MTRKQIYVGKESEYEAEPIFRVCPLHIIHLVDDRMLKEHENGEALLVCLAAFKAVSVCH